MNKRVEILRFWKYFAISLLVISIITMIFSCIHSFDRIIYIYNLPLKDLLYYNFQILQISLISYISDAICISSFLTFRKLSNNPFGKSLITILVSIIPLIILTIVYTCNIKPVINKNLYNSMWKAKSGETIPLYIIDSKPDLMTYKELCFRLDSMEHKQVELVTQTKSLYYKLAKEIKKDFKDTDNILNIDFESNKSIKNNKNLNDSISDYYTFTDKYNETYDNYKLIRTFNIDLYTRYIPIFSIPLLFLLFSILGFYLKKESLNKILVIIAIIIISTFLLYYMNYLMKDYIGNIISLRQ